jgi:N-acetylglucosamine PTS system EIICBA or EIICB component
MSKAKVTDSKKSGLRIPGFAQLQRLGKSLMLPIALLPAAGILLRLGQPDLLGGINVPVIPSASPRRPTARPPWPPLPVTW